MCRPAATQLQRPLDVAGRALVQRALGEELVVVHAVALERRLDLGQQQLDRTRGRPPSTLSEPRRRDLGGQLGHVLALVAALGHLGPRSPAPSPTRRAARSAAGVVEVVLARDVVAVVLRGSAPASRRRRRGGRWRRPAARSGWRTRTPAGSARRGSAPPAPNRSPASRIDASAPRCQRVGQRQVHEPGAGDLEALAARRRARRSASPRRARRSRAAGTPAPAPAASPRWSSSRPGRHAWGARPEARRAALGPAAADRRRGLARRARAARSSGRAHALVHR